MFFVKLPYPPSINNYYRRTARGVFIGKEGRTYRKKVCLLLSALNVTRMDSSLFAEVSIFPPDNRRRDIDNVQKALFDAMEHGGVYKDDSQIKKLLIEKFHPVEGGEVWVKLTEYESDD